MGWGVERVSKLPWGLLGQLRPEFSRARSGFCGEMRRAQPRQADVWMRLQLPRWSRHWTGFEAAADRRQMRRAGDAHRIEADDLSCAVPPNHVAERNEADQNQQLTTQLSSSQRQFE